MKNPVFHFFTGIHGLPKLDGKIFKSCGSPKPHVTLVLASPVEEPRIYHPAPIQAKQDVQ